MVDIIVQADGLKAPDAAELVTKPLEDDRQGHRRRRARLQPDRRTTASWSRRASWSAPTRTTRSCACTRRCAPIIDRIPLGIPEPLIVGRGINDVAIVTLDAVAQARRGRALDRQRPLRSSPTKLQAELTKVDNVGLTYIVRRQRRSRSASSPIRRSSALYGVTLQQLDAKIAGRQPLVPGRRRSATTAAMAQSSAGQTLQGIPDIGLLLVTTRDGRPVYVRDLANVVHRPEPDEHHVWIDAEARRRAWSAAPAVTLALAKRAGANAVVVAERMVSALDALKGRSIPADVNVEVTRDYGETANDKANELLFHLALATVSIVLLIGFAIGWREAG